MRKIVFVDIDGTIIDCSRGLHKPTLATEESFRKLKEEGNLVFIASGRAKCLVPESVKALKPSGYLLANGAYAEIDGKVIFSETMSKDVKRRIIAFADRNDCAYYLETADAIYTRDLDLPLHKKFAQAWDVCNCYRDDGYHEDLGINIGMLAIRDDDLLVDRVYEELLPYVNINRHGSMYSFDINIKGMSKGEGIKKILDVLNIAKEDSFAFGDGYNDIEMFETVGKGIAVQNAVDELKEVAADITMNVIDDGFTHGLKKYRLIK